MRAIIRIACFALLLLPAPAHAWGGAGHRIVCGIAWARLTPQAHTMVAHLLGSNDEKTFADACVWADSIRSERPETSAYHWINIPAGMGGMDMARDCGDVAARCAPWAIAHFAAVLTDRGTTDATRSDALKFVMHFVGDLHQPLHAGRPEDRGGNGVTVDFFGDVGTAERANNLHSVWDSQILRRANRTWPASSQWLVSELAPDEAQAWETLDVVGWTNESYRLCEDYVYGRLNPDHRIRDLYYRPALGIVEVRLQQAGVRLAYLLNMAAAGPVNIAL